jgi:hypothetical protein
MNFRLCSCTKRKIFLVDFFGDTLNFEFVYAYREERFGWGEKACDGAKRKKHL